MNRSHSHPRTRKGKASRIALVAVAALAVLGFAAYQFLLNRPGEAAIAFLPADADVVVTLDTNPSQRQLSVFMKITAALEREGIAKKLDETLAQAFDGKPIAAEIQPHFQRSFAMAAWNPKGQPQLTVTLLSIDDPAAVEASLKTHGQPKGDGSYAIPGTNEQMFAAVVDKYLAVANSDVALMRVGRVRAGAEPSVAKSSAFAAARATLPEDANVMVFLAPRFFENMGDAPGGRALGAATWMAASATVVPEGIQFDYQGPVDASKMPSLAALGQIAPIDLTALKQLPDGAYGVAAYSQGGRYWNSMDESVGKEPALADGFKDAVGTFEKETGLSIAKDLVPALMGEQVLAIYPGNLGQPSDVEGALLLTDAHGANPASLAAKV
ncbi:MAG: DUF3352 domain-containing protein, partial [Chthonomonadaceae bacterium]|nr:DUF3352 domain-containing protein [Chthonomonadaceae bacterium]